MIELCGSYKHNNTVDFYNEIINEVLMSIIINKYIFKEKLFLGDCGNYKLPDLFSEDYNYGFEITQCELDCDLDMHVIEKEMQKTNNSYSKTISNLKNRNFNIDDYEIMPSQNDRILSLCHKEGSRDRNYLYSTYERVLDKKLNKLCNGNYKDCKNISLVISCIERRKSFWDAKLINFAYKSCLSRYKFGFENVFYIITDGIFEIKNDVQEIVEYSDNEFSDCVKEMKRFLHFENRL